MRSLILALFLPLAACVGPIETRLDNAGLVGQAPATFQMDAEAPNATRALVQAELVQKGLSPSEAGAINVQVTMSDRLAQLSLGDGKTLLSPAAGKQSCADREYRVGVTLTRIADGTLVYRGTAAEFHCKQSVEQVLPLLIKAALTDLGAPKGAYSIKRPRR
jgi:hypothetical protein